MESVEGGKKALLCLVIYCTSYKLQAYLAANLVFLWNITNYIVIKQLTIWIVTMFLDMNKDIYSQGQSKTKIWHQTSG